MFELFGYTLCMQNENTVSMAGNIYCQIMYCRFRCR